MEKRGIAITFKWIFALIAGFIIFLFLINFAYKHIYISEKTTSAILLSNLENQISSLSIAEDLDTTLDLGQEFTINFDCNSISSEKAKINTENIIFSNNQIKSKELSLWSKTWKYPFSITNFFFLVDKNTKFYLFNSPYDIYSQIPEQFNIYTYPDTVPENAILIFFKQPTTNELIKYKDHQIKIIQDNKVNFYPDKTSNYYGDEMLLGAIFTDDFYKFECLKQKALSKLHIISSVYIKKAETLANIECSDQYQFIISLLNKFKSNPINPEAIINADKELERNGCTPLFQ